MSRLSFQLEAMAPGSSARAGRFRTLHSEVLTPLFMPVGTRATVRNQRFQDLRESGSQILLANTYHLLLKPGPELFQRMGGIHKLMNWEQSVLTDSGGFQIFSLENDRKITEEGAEFTSFVDSKRILLTPEISIGMQKAIGSDIMMVLDQCGPSTSARPIAEAAMHLTHRWAQRSLDARGESPQSLFGIVQGACFEDLRKQSADTLTQMPFDGFAIGGLAVGETKNEREDFTEMTAKLLPQNLPRYLMGVGKPIDLLEAVHRGVDMFDCILPVSLAQQGVSYTSVGRIDLKRGIYTYSEDRLDPNCSCHTCQTYSRAYLRHLIKWNELLGWQLVATHNLYFYHSLMKEMRENILRGTFLEYYQEKRKNLDQKDEENPVVNLRRKAKKPAATSLGAFEKVVSHEGFASIKHVQSGEIMHASISPNEEARRVYAEQSRLAQRVLQQDDSPEVVLWDVGLGAGFNLIAAVQCVESTAELFPGSTIKPLHIYTFEKDMDAIQLALLDGEAFPHLGHSAPRTLLKRGEWQSKNQLVKISLIQGDFLELFPRAAAPDLIFYDPFSYRTDHEMWSLPTFQKIHAFLKEKKEAELFTYSASTEMRVRLLEAGFHVAHGIATGPKAETTIAMTSGRTRFWSREKFLGDQWLKRWEKSPFHNSGWNVRQHSQFVGS